MVAAAQKLLQEQQRADALLKAKLEADAEIASMRASMQQQQHRLQQLDQALAASGVASPLKVQQQPVAAPQPGSSEQQQQQQQQQQQFMPDRDQRLWEQTQLCNR